jgi:DegV family protein with EDD domain
MIGIVVDSNSQMSADLANRFGISTVALAVTVDGVEYREGIDLHADAFYAAWDHGHQPTIETSQPSPGAFVEAYQALIDAGATEVLSIHISEALSGTLNSARLAATQVDVLVRLVDTGTASFGISCCAWAAAEAIVEGADLTNAADVATERGLSLHSNFVVGIPKLIDRSGRADGVGVELAATDGVPVLAMTGPNLSVLATVIDVETAVSVMVQDALSRTPSCLDGLRIAIGTSDATSRPVALAVTEALTGHAAVADVVQYRIGPSVGAHTGPGTCGLFVF